MFIILRYSQLLFLLIFYSGIYSQDKMEIAALNRITMNRGDTVYQFYAVKPVKKIKFDQDKSYYWYVMDTILITQSGGAGRVLNGSYKVFHPNKNIMEEGIFKNGLKDGLWKEWYPNGILKLSVNWSKGMLNGQFDEFDNAGRKLRTGSYKSNLFTGNIFIYLENGSSQKVYYQNGKIIIEKKQPEIDNAKAL